MLINSIATVINIRKLIQIKVHLAHNIQNRSGSDCEHEAPSSEQTPLTGYNKKVDIYVPRYQATILAVD